MEDKYVVSRHDHFQFQDETIPQIKFIPHTDDQNDIVIALEPSIAQVL